MVHMCMRLHKKTTQSYTVCTTGLVFGFAKHLSGSLASQKPLEHVLEDFSPLYDHHKHPARRTHV